MDKKTFFAATAVIFFLIGAMHVLRLWFGWEGVIGGWMVPVWLSWVAVVVAFFLAYQGFQFFQKR